MEKKFSLALALSQYSILSSAGIFWFSRFSIYPVLEIQLDELLVHVHVYIYCPTLCSIHTLQTHEVFCTLY